MWSIHSSFNRAKHIGSSWMRVNIHLSYLRAQTLRLSAPSLQVHTHNLRTHIEQLLCGQLKNTAHPSPIPSPHHHHHHLFTRSDEGQRSVKTGKLDFCSATIRAPGTTTTTTTTIAALRLLRQTLSLRRQETLPVIVPCESQAQESAVSKCLHPLHGTKPWLAQSFL